MVRVRRKLPFKDVKKFTIAILNELDEDNISLEDLVKQVYNKILESGRPANKRNSSTTHRRYATTISKVANSVGWTSYIVKYNSFPKTHLRRVC